MDLGIGNLLVRQLVLASAAQVCAPGHPDADRHGDCASDGELVARARDGDRRAFDLLYQRHADRVHRRLTRLLGPVAEREDLVQEVFVLVFRGLDTFRGDAAFSTWLYRIVANVAYGQLRRRRRRPPEWARSPEVEQLASAAAEHGPDAAAERRQQLASALELLDALSPDKRIAFVLRVVEGRSLQEIGRIVGARPAAVGQRIRRAHRDLERLAARQRRRRARKEARRR